jgi:hypothetical protein
VVFFPCVESSVVAIKPLEDHRARCHPRIETRSRGADRIAMDVTGNGVTQGWTFARRGKGLSGEPVSVREVGGEGCFCWCRERVGGGGGGQTPIARLLSLPMPPSNCAV